MASAAWLAARGIVIPPRQKWKVAITIEDDDKERPTCLQILIESGEWGFRFARDNSISWIRVGDAPAVQERDDFDLVGQTPELRNLGNLVQRLEDRFKIRFRRTRARIRTNLVDAEDKIRVWVVASL